MIQPTRLLIDLARNSRSSSQRNRLVARSSEPFAVTRKSHILPLYSTADLSKRSPPSSIEQHPQLALSLAPPIHQTKPIGHGPSSGLALCIFSSPARLRLRSSRLNLVSPCRQAKNALQNVKSSEMWSQCAKTAQIAVSGISNSTFLRCIGGGPVRWPNPRSFTRSTGKAPSKKVSDLESNQGPAMVIQKQ